MKNNQKSVRKNFAPTLLHLVKILKKDEKNYKYWRKNIEKWMEKETKRDKVRRKRNTKP